MKNNSGVSTTPVYTLSVTADLSGIHVHSIRQYIDKGLMIAGNVKSIAALKITLI